ncbi:fungal-specific transcription factor domain-containing protein [Aspergillus germanicus]
MPILDAAEFLETYSARECEGISLLLLWSMFFASSNFVSPTVLDKAGFQTRKSMKRFMYQRAKHLYDSEYETDKISLIQSVLLMSFWYNDPEERSGAWHWVGVGISLCQSLGLHRHPKIVNSRHALSHRREALFRRIWWNCVIRDRWMALAKGRPLRINLLDCDVPLPCLADITDELDAIPSERRTEYIPYEPGTLALFWVKFVSTSISLGTVLEAHYRVGLPRAGVADLERCRRQIEQNSLDIDDAGMSDPVMNLFGYQLQLFHEATVLVLYRPYIFKGPADPLPEVQDSWQRRASERARSAASNTNKVLEKVLEKDLVKWMTPMT